MGDPNPPVPHLVGMGVSRETERLMRVQYENNVKDVIVNELRTLNTQFHGPEDQKENANEAHASQFESTWTHVLRAMLSKEVSFNSPKTGLFSHLIGDTHFIRRCTKENSTAYRIVHTCLTYFEKQAKAYPDETRVPAEVLENNKLLFHEVVVHGLRRLSSPNRTASYWQKTFCEFKLDRKKHRNLVGYFDSLFALILDFLKARQQEEALREGQVQPSSALAFLQPGTVSHFDQLGAGLKGEPVVVKDENGDPFLPTPSSAPILIPHGDDAVIILTMKKEFLQETIDEKEEQLKGQIEELKEWVEQADKARRADDARVPNEKKRKRDMEGMNEQEAEGYTNQLKRIEEENERRHKDRTRERTIRDTRVLTVRREVDRLQEKKKYMDTLIENEQKKRHASLNTSRGPDLTYPNEPSFLLYDGQKVEWDDLRTLRLSERDYIGLLREGLPKALRRQIELGRIEILGTLRAWRYALGEADDAEERAKTVSLFSSLNDKKKDDVEERARKKVNERFGKGKGKSSAPHHSSSSAPSSQSFQRSRDQSRSQNGGGNKSPSPSPGGGGFHTPPPKHRNSRDKGSASAAQSAPDKAIAAGAGAPDPFTVTGPKWLFCGVC